VGLAYHGQGMVGSVQPPFCIFLELILDPSWLCGGSMDDPMLGLHHKVATKVLELYEV